MHEAHERFLRRFTGFSGLRFGQRRCLRRILFNPVNPVKNASFVSSVSVVFFVVKGQAHRSNLPAMAFLSAANGLGPKPAPWCRRATPPGACRSGRTRQYVHGLVIRSAPPPTGQESFATRSAAGRRSLPPQPSVHRAKMPPDRCCRHPHRRA